MEYQVLARRWRPRHFSQMVGQTTIVQALQNALTQERVHHAYLFTGTRGVGKTTLARILAKCLNCETGITHTPCEQCRSCQEISQGGAMDVLEIDAASRTKVEDTRDLLDNVIYAPAHSRFKIYLIDEVHMLSGHSFNALLKTLEEPPAHVKFLLATTDPKKLPNTVLSRCLQFHLRPLPAEHIASHLAHVLKEEKITAEASALLLLAQAADGSVRDALTLLDQAIAYSQQNIQENAVRDMLGLVNEEALISLVQALANNDARSLLETAQTLAQSSSDCARVLEQLLQLLHHLALVQTCPQATLSSSISIDTLTDLAKTLDKNAVQLFYQMGLIARRDLPLAPTPKIGLEMALLRMLAFKPWEQTSSQAAPSTPAARSTPAPKANPEIKIAPAIDLQPAAPVTKAAAPISTVTPTDTDEARHALWNDLQNQLQLTGLLRTICENCSLKTFTPERIELLVDPKQAVLLNTDSQAKIEALLQKHLGNVAKLSIQPGSKDLLTPQQHVRKTKEAQTAKAKLALKEDPKLQQLQEKFSATLLESHIKAVREDS